MGYTGLIIATLLVVIIGGGGFYLLWTMTRPKKRTWKAHVFITSDGKREEKKDSKGRIIQKGGLRDLIFYTKDTVEEINKGAGNVIYRLKKLKKTLPPVDGKVVMGLGDNAYVNVLYKDGLCTLMRPGFSEHGDMLFDPVPYDRLSLVSNEIELQRRRREDNRDVLEKVLPWVGIGLFIFGMVAVAYFHGEAIVKSSDNYKKAAETYKESVGELVNATRTYRTTTAKTDGVKLGPQTKVKTIGQ